MADLFDFSYFPDITTERLALRRLTHDDADAIVAIFGSPDVLRFLNQSPTDTHDKALDLINWFEENFQQHRGVQWGIAGRGSNHVIGTCGFYGWDRENRRVDIGYHIAPSEWGKGYATEAACAMITWCFDHLNVHRIQADCTAGNDASERVMIKCGFTLEGVWRESCWEHERFVNIKQYGLLRHEHKR
jgi:[ribosomal protein S5]-alanine N-acetyltransferase